MEVYTSTDAQRVFGEVLMKSQREPVRITRNNKPVAVVVSEDDYQKFKHQALQQAITDGIESGEPSPLNMTDIKNKARQKMGLDAKN